MGWKNLRDAFGIRHYVQVSDKGVCIGSGCVHDLVTINPTTGARTANPTFREFLRETYPALHAASDAEIRQLLATQDSFSRSVPVFTYEGGEIVEKHCEEPGWPNATHDGHLMYANTYSTNRDRAVSRAKEDATIAIESTRARIAAVEIDLAERKAQLARHEANLAKLNADYPDVG